MHAQDVTTPTAAKRLVRAATLAILLAAVAVAFADSSIVVLALPDLLSQFNVSIGSVAWVVTAYNLVLAATALALVRVAPRFDPVRLAVAGAGTFLAASLSCALAPEIWSLVSFRAVQGLGATLLLLGALPLVRGLARTPERGSVLWTGAGVFGAALGPALGGILTELFSWRAIFYAQAPVAALAVVACLGLRAPAGEATTEPVPQEARSERQRRAAAGVALLLASAALVGLLFLAVVQLIDVWRLSPLRAGAVVSTIPLATLLAAPFAASGGAAVTGAVLLAGGLGGMALVPGPSVGWVIAALAVAGLGYGLLVPGVARAALSTQRSPVASGALTLALRHAGLVAGLLVLTPLLAGDLSDAADKAELRGIATVLDAPLSATDKIRLAVDLAPVLGAPPSKGLPDFSRALASEHASGGAGLGGTLDAIVQATVTRGFRTSFAAAALFALLAAVPIVLVSRRRSASRRVSLGTPGLAAVAAIALVGTELAGGALAYGARPKLLPPCVHRPAPAASGGDAEAQRLVLAGVDLLACRLHETREQLVAHAAERGVAGAQLAAEIARSAGVLSHLPSWLRP